MRGKGESARGGAPYPYGGQESIGSRRSDEPYPYGGDGGELTGTKCRRSSAQLEGLEVRAAVFERWRRRDGQEIFETAGPSHSRCLGCARGLQQKHGLAEPRITWSQSLDNSSRRFSFAWSCCWPPPFLSSARDSANSAFGAPSPSCCSAGIGGSPGGSARRSSGKCRLRTPYRRRTPSGSLEGDRAEGWPRRSVEISDAGDRIL